MNSIGRTLRTVYALPASVMLTLAASSSPECSAQQTVAFNFNVPYATQQTPSQQPAIRQQVAPQPFVQQPFVAQQVVQQPHAPQQVMRPAGMATPRPTIRMAGMQTPQSIVEGNDVTPPRQEMQVQPAQQSMGIPDYVNQSQPMTAPGSVQGSSCGYSRCNLPPQPQGIPSGCPECIVGLDCKDACYPQSWCEVRPIEFQKLWHGEYQGPIRLPAVEQYRVRIGDRLKFTYINSRTPINEDYRLTVGDEIIVDSKTDPSIRIDSVSKSVTIQPDGKIYLPLVDPVNAAGKTIRQLRRDLENEYKPYITVPSIDVFPVKTNITAEDLRLSVTGQVATNGQNAFDTVHPDGTVTLPRLGQICVLGLTQAEIKREVNLRIRQIVFGVEIEPSIDAEAPHFVYVYGQVGKPDRYQLLGPTTVTQALAMAQAVTDNGNSRQIVIFRRAEDWRLMSTRIDIKGVHLGKTGTPADEIWLRDNDLIIVPPTPIHRFDVFVRQVFTQGIYGIVPFQGISITNLQNGSISGN